jgi:predicted DCC family thiol-disulfide oxidoreductase YuxK
MTKEGGTLKSGEEQHGIILFDGVCAFCNTVVRFIYARDTRGYFRFAPLQSEFAKELLAPYGMTNVLDSALLIENGTVSDYSTTVFRIMRHLKFPWPLLYPLIFIPRPLRDFGYHIVAENRYKWFGKHESCPVPPAGLAERFLD